MVAEKRKFGMKSIRTLRVSVISKVLHFLGVKLVGSALNYFFAVSRRELKAKHNRFAPAGEHLQTRWSRAAEMGFGEGTSIYDSTLVLGDVVVGKNTWIGPFVVLDGSGGLSIGSYCSISAGTQIYTHDSVAWAGSAGAKPIKLSRVEIGDRCYFGPNVIVQRGVKIGDGAVIGANSFVNKDVPAGSFVAGNPARKVR